MSNGDGSLSGYSFTPDNLSSYIKKHGDWPSGSSTDTSATTGADLNTAGAIMATGAAVTSAIGNYFSSESNKISLQSQADIADINAQVAELNAQSALMQGQRQVAQITLQAGQLKSRQRASMAANGVDLGDGSAAEVQASTDVMKEADANTAHANAVANAWGYRTQENNYQNDALIKRSTAAATSPSMGAFTTLLGGAGDAVKSWAKVYGA
jgi:hypothetical protein